MSRPILLCATLFLTVLSVSGRGPLETTSSGSGAVVIGTQNLKVAKQNMGAGQSEVRVQIVGPNRHPLSHPTGEASDPIRTSGRRRVSWEGKTDVSSLSRQPVQLRISLLNAKLYSFQFGHSK